MIPKTRLILKLSWITVRNSRTRDGVITLYQYNAKGEVEYTATDMDQNSTLDFSGTDRITRAISDVLHDSALNADVRRTRTYIWTNNGTDSPLLTSTTETSADGLHSWQTSYGLTNESITVFGSSGYSR